MSRTLRRNRRTGKLVPDKDNAWNCGCSWCASLQKKKLIKKLHLLEITQGKNTNPRLLRKKPDLTEEDKEWIDKIDGNTLTLQDLE